MRILVVPVHGEGQPLVEHAEIEAHVHLAGSLPLDVRVRQDLGRTDAHDERAVQVVTIVLVGLQGGSVLIRAQGVDITVHTPGGAQLEEGEVERFLDPLHKGFVADGPTGGDGREVAPAVILVQLGAVVRVGAEVGLEEVLVGEGIADTAEVGHVRPDLRLAADRHIGVVHGVVEVAEIRIVAGEDVGGAAEIVRVGLLVGHTRHHGEVVLAERLVIVGEILPLVVEAVVRRAGDGHRLVGLRADVHLVVVGVGVAVAALEAEAGGDDQARKRHQVRVGGTPRAEALRLGVRAVQDGLRVPHIARLVERGDAIDVAVGIAGELVVDHTLDARGNGVVVIDVRGGRIVDEHRAHHGLGDGRALGNGPAHAPVDGRVHAHGQPILHLVFGIDLADQATEDILVALDDTVIVRIGQGSVELGPVVAAFHAHGVALLVAGLQHVVGPLGVRLAVVIEAVRGRRAGQHHIVHILLRVHHLGQVRDILDRVLEVVEHAAGALLAGLRRDEHDTVTGFDTIDGGGGGILQDFDGGDGLRIQVADVIDLEAVHDHQRGRPGIRGITADLDGGGGTRRTGSVHDLDAGRLALQGLGDIRGRTVLQVGLLHGSDGARDVALALDAVTDDDGFLQEFSVFRQDDVDDGTAGHGDRLRCVADAGIDEGSIGRNADRIVSIQVGLSSNSLVTAEHHRGTNDRLATRICDFSLDRGVLGEGFRPGNDQQPCEEKAANGVEDFHHG